ncbi:MAG: nickel ABC transporter permease [Acidobacteriota bacterium]
MKRFVLRRLLLSLVTLWGVVTFVFLLIHLVPGDPVETMLGEGARPQDVAQMRQKLGLDLPLATQYGRFVERLVHGDLGVSFRSNDPVGRVIRQAYPATIRLALAGLFVAVAIAIPLGVFAARRRGTWADAAASVISLLGVSVPHFALGPLLIVLFSIQLSWLPVSGSGTFAHMVLPAVTLGLALAAILMRMTRSSMLNELAQPYVTTARAKGLPERRVVYYHALRNGLIPILTILGLQFGVLLAGAIITETIFSWPGLGRLVVQGIQSRDYPLVQGCILVISMTYVMVNLLTDLVYGWVDPRIRLR